MAKALVKNPVLTKKCPNISEIIVDNLIKTFNEGPVVSFNGSPTVSAMLAAVSATLYDCLSDEMRTSLL